MKKTLAYKDHVSIIIPTYNRAHLIKRSLQSVLKQDYPNFEIIVIDDASTDNTEYIVKELDDVRVIYIQHSFNKGANAARNTGIRAATGEYIAFQDSDDEWLPDKLTKQIEAFKTAPTDVGVVYTACWRIEGTERTYTPSKDVLVKDGFLHNELLKRNFITMPSLLVKKECLKEVGLFDEALPRLQDWELFLRLSNRYQFLFIDEALVNAYHTPGSITSNQKALADALVLMLEKHYDEFAQHKKILANFYCYMGQQFFLSDERAKSLHYCVKALKMQPFNPKFWLIMMTFALGKNVYPKVKRYVLKALKLFSTQRR